MKFAHIRVSEYFTFAEQIFHSETISLARRANFVEKSTHLSGRQMCAFFWRRRRDLNARKMLISLSCGLVDNILTSFYELVELVRDFLNVRFSKIGVDIHCGGELLVAEDLLHHFRRDTVLKRDRRE